MDRLGLALCGRFIEAGLPKPLLTESEREGVLAAAMAACPRALQAEDGQAFADAIGVDVHVARLDHVVVAVDWGGIVLATTGDAEETERRLFWGVARWLLMQADVAHNAADAAALAHAIRDLLHLVKECDVGEAESSAA